MSTQIPPIACYPEVSHERTQKIEGVYGIDEYNIKEIAFNIQCVPVGDQEARECNGNTQNSLRHK